MKERAKASSTSLFLMELILSILIFSIAAAICVSAFAKSHQLSRESLHKNQAVTSTSGMAELVRASDSLQDAIAAAAIAYPHASLSEEQAIVWFDEHGLEASQEDAVCFMETRFDSSDGMLRARISYWELADETAPVYSLSVRTFTGEEVTEA